MSTRPSMPVTGIAVSAAALGAAIALIVPMSASAAAPVSQAEGRLLTATIAGTPSAPLLNLAGAEAVDANGTGTVTSDTPLDATVLDALNLRAGTTDLFGATGIIQLGAVGQFAQARDDGSSVAFSGTVSSAPSLVGSGTTVTGSNLGTPGAGNSASIGIGDPATSPISIDLVIGAVAASAQQPASGAPSGAYVLDDVGATVGGTVIAPVSTAIAGVLDPVLLVVNPLLGTPVADPFTGGTISITASDLLAAAGVADLDHLAPGTDLMSFLPAAVVAKVNALANGVLTQLQTAAGGLDPIVDTVAIAAIAGLATTLATTLTTVTTGLAAAVGTALSALVSAPGQQPDDQPGRLVHPERDHRQRAGGVRGAGTRLGRHRERHGGSERRTRDGHSGRPGHDARCTPRRDRRDRAHRCDARRGRAAGGGRVRPHAARRVASSRCAPRGPHLALTRRGTPREPGPDQGPGPLAVQ
ncbi:choice-of-anchor G family protein [Pseudolysinimonas sp.]|uniref:choice-of-anchor G family protein n=1 Tax=Pseudolysinimonas sp. TaxID=2680009 RepID=UPI003F7D15DA